MKILSDSELQKQIIKFIDYRFENNKLISFIDLLKEFLPNREDLIMQFTKSHLLKNRGIYAEKKNLFNKDLLLPLSDFRAIIKSIKSENTAKDDDDKYNPPNIKLPVKLPDIDDFPGIGNPKFTNSIPPFDPDDFEDDEKDVNDFDADELVEKIKEESDLLLKQVIEAKRIDRDLYEKTLMLATKKIMAAGKSEQQIKVITEIRNYLEKTNTFNNTKDSTMQLGDEEIAAVERLESVYAIPPRSSVK